MKKITNNMMFVFSIIVMMAMLNVACGSHKPVTRDLVTGEVIQVVDKEKPLGKWYKCSACNETGRCATCKGTGKVNGKKCGKCDGTGSCLTCYGQGGWRSEE